MSIDATQTDIRQIMEDSLPSADEITSALRPAARAPAKLALVVPTLHEVANIETILNRARTTLDPLGIPYELIVVDDDSQDGTSELVQRISDSDPRVRLMVRKNARGLGGAVVHGWDGSDAEVIGVMDADLQHPPEILPQLWKAMESGADLALASRYAENGSLRHWNPVRRGLSHLAIWLTVPLQRRAIRVQDPMSGFFLVRRACLRDVQLKTQGFKILLEILVRADIHSVTEIPFSFGLREAGDSKAGVKEGFDYLSLLGRLYRGLGLRRRFSRPTPPVATPETGKTMRRVG
jgi:dolichol-phosphate mannosyltransferase